MVPSDAISSANQVIAWSDSIYLHQAAQLHTQNIFKWNMNKNQKFQKIHLNKHGRFCS